MKINTKAATPLKTVAPNMKNVPDNCFFIENKYLPEGAAALNGKGDENTIGRIDGFQVTFSILPVRPSGRIMASSKTPNSAVSGSIVDKLMHMFGKLTMSDTKVETKDSKKLTPLAVEEKQDVDEVDEEDEKTWADEEKLGRFTTRTPRNDCRKMLTVVRSRRIANKK